MSVHVPSSGWATWLVHPDTDRVLQADVTGDPAIDPSLNSLPRIRLPVQKSTQWQELSGRPTMNVYLDGEEQPIDELTKPIDAKGQADTVLEGRGGVELLERVEAEYSSASRFTAAEDLITTHTSYDADVPTPSFPEVDGGIQQNPTSTADFQDVLTIATDIPLEITSDTVTVLQTCFTQEGEDSDSANNPTSRSNDAYSDGSAAVFSSLNQTRQYNFTTDHEIAPSDFDIGVRWASTGSTGSTADLEWRVDGDLVSTYSPGDNAADDPQWREDIINVEPADGGLDDTLPTGSHTLEISVSSTGDDGFVVDVVAPHDTRYSYDFDNTLSSNGGWLDGPQFFPAAIDVGFDPAVSTFSVTDGSNTISMDDTSNNQRVQVRNTRGGTWLPNDGTEDNTTSVSVDPFPDSGFILQTRITLSRYSPSGTRDETPRTGYSGQTIQDYNLTGTVEQESLLIDESFDNTLDSILTEIAGDEYFWAYRLVDGTPTVSFLKPGARTGNDPDLIQATVEKDIDTYHKISVKGANKQVSDERFSASTSDVNLNNTFIVPGTETVYDPSAGDNFDRGTDYEMNWQAGKISATSSGSLTIGTEYAIDYRHEVEGSYTDPNAPSDFRERVVEIPAVTSTRNAEQIAYVLVELDGVNEPRYAADITVPPSVATFDAIEALPLDTLDIPDDVGALEVEEPPEVTPRGTKFRLGTSPPLEDRLSDIQSQLQQVSRRSG